MTPLLEVAGLSLVLGGRCILEGVDLRVREGERHALLGANGAGKSSLAYCLMGCSGYRPQSGTLVLAGEDLTAAAPARAGAARSRARLAGAGPVRGALRR